MTDELECLGNTDRVSSIGPAAVSRYDVEDVGKQIYYLAFAFISPRCADNGECPTFAKDFSQSKVNPKQLQVLHEKVPTCVIAILQNSKKPPFVQGRAVGGESLWIFVFDADLGLCDNQLLNIIQEVQDVFIGNSHSGSSLQ